MAIEIYRIGVANYCGFPQNMIDDCSRRQVKESFPDDLLEFQKEVLRDFERLKEEYERAALISKTGYGKARYETTASLSRKALLKILRPIERSLNYYYFRTPEFLEIGKRAGTLLKSSEIKDILCPVFKMNLTDDLFTERLEIEVILILTYILTRRTISERLSLGKDPKLFARMTYQILEQGLSTFCRD
jgi:hypothetical protein